MINSGLLKEAIADAKAVRATALANAKASLEEAFAPRFEAMFAEKLKEEADEDGEDFVNEHEAPNQVSASGGEAKGPSTKPVTKGEPKIGSAAKKPFKTIAVGGSQGAAGSKAPAAKQSIVSEIAEDETEELDENSMEPSIDDEQDSNFTLEGLDELIAELEAEVDGQQAPAPIAPQPTPGEGAPESQAVAPQVAPPVSPDELSSEVPSEVDSAPAPVAPEAPAPVAPSAEGEEEVNLEELLAALNEETDEEKEEETLDEISNNGMPKNVGGADKAGKTVSNKNIEATKTPNTCGDIGKGSVGGKPTLEEVAKYKKALKESYNAITFLRGQINEVNLLNAKLLYTNKLFKEFSSQLDDSRRLKIVESFDLTKSVREVKLSYALLAEQMSFRKNDVSTKNVAQPTYMKKTVNQITEGLASKPVASTKPSKEIISEGSAMAARFKQLAGIKQK